jgi:hypothetical protein
VKKYKIVVGTADEIDDPGAPKDEFVMLLWDTTRERKLIARYSGKLTKVFLLVAIKKVIERLEPLLTNFQEPNNGG